MSTAAVSGSRIGIDLGGTKIEGVVLDQSGAEIARWYTEHLGSARLGMVISMIGFNFLGDGLRDALDPKDR